MTIKHNQQIQHNHFRKDWQRRVRVHFDQPGRKQRRRQARHEKAAKVAPRPVDKLRPVVRCPTVKYNRRVRAGRGFTFAELKEAGIPRKLARTIGISVDPRRVNLSEESLAINVERLKTYKARLVLFPRKAKSPKNGEASAEDMKKHHESVEEQRESGSRYKAHHTHGDKVKHLKDILPISNKHVVEEGKIADYEGEEAAYRKLRTARSDAKLVGKREKRAKQKEEEAAAQKK